MAREIKNGESPTVTSFTGASAAPSHAPAPRPHVTPSTCNDWAALGCASARWLASFVFSSMEISEQRNAQRQHDGRRPELTVGQDRLEHGRFHSRPPLTCPPRKRSHSVAIRSNEEELYNGTMIAEEVFEKKKSRLRSVRR